MSRTLNQNNTVIPTEIYHGGVKYTSPRNIANVMNRFFKEKVETMREKFVDPSVDPIELLGKLISRPGTSFSIPMIDYQACYNIIMKLRLSKSCGLDDITTKMLKQVPKISALYMVHLINNIIRSGKYPETPKIT